VIETIALWIGYTIMVLAGILVALIVASFFLYYIWHQGKVMKDFLWWHHRRKAIMGMINLSEAQLKRLEFIRLNPGLGAGMLDKKILQTFTEGDFINKHEGKVWIARRGRQALNKVRRLY